MPGSSRIDQTFAALKNQQRMAFMPFITAGDPDLAATTAAISELARRGVDLIEIGFPYSDPIADGPVIQASYTRALARGITMEGIFAAIAKLTQGGESLPPLVAMVSYAIVFRRSPEVFVRQAAAAGFSGLIVPDLPGDEAAEFSPVVRAGGLDLIQLVAPTTPPERVDRILRTASGFLYCISTAGTTGVRAELPPQLSSQLQWLRGKTRLPLAVGFGVSKPEQIHALRGLADGVIVGSALVRHFEAMTADANQRAEVLRKAGDLAAEMANAAHEGGGKRA